MGSLERDVLELLRGILAFPSMRWDAVVRGSGPEVLHVAARLREHEHGLTGYHFDGRRRADKCGMQRPRAQLHAYDDYCSRVRACASDVPSRDTARGRGK